MHQWAEGIDETDKRVIKYCDMPESQCITLNLKWNDGNWEYVIGLCPDSGDLKILEGGVGMSILSPKELKTMLLTHMDRPQYWANDKERNLVCRNLKLVFGLLNLRKS